MAEEFHINYKPAEDLPLQDLTYVIIGTREDNKWIFVRHKDRSSWELPAGHIEDGETATEAAARELWEETGVTEADIHPIQDYSISTNGTTKNGRIFLAHVKKREVLPDSEIAEIKLAEISPEPPTYPEAHRSFLNFLNAYIQ